MRKVLLVGAFLVMMLGGETTISSPQAAAQESSYYWTVYNAAQTYGVSADYLWNVVGCETGYTYALNLWGPNGEYGPFQFMEGTFYEFAYQSGIGGSWYDPVSQAYVAAWAFANGYSYRWVCA